MRKVIVIVLALVSVAGLVFAGGGQGEAGAEGGSAANVNRAGFPIVKEPITLTAAAVQHAWSRNWGEFDMFKEYEKLTGITIDWTMIPHADTVEKVNLMLASGDYRDMIFVPGLAGRAAEAAAEGLLLPLNGLIKEWAPSITKMFQEQPLMEQVGTMVDGNIYGFGRFHNTSTHLMTQRQWYIVEPWLENLGLEMPETPDELYALLQAFKERDANGNGDPNDEIPLSFWTAPNGSIAEWITLFGPWGVVDTYMVDNNGKVRLAFLDEGYKEGLKFYKKLAAEGLLDMESISQNRNQLKARASKDGLPILGMSYALAPQFLWSNNDILFYYVDVPPGAVKSVDDLEINRERQIGIVPPLKGPGGKQLWQENMGGNHVSRDVAFLFNTNSNPEASTRWMDSWYDGEEMGKTMLSGQEGLMWVYDEEGGVFVEIPPPSDWKGNRNEWRAWNCPGTGGFGVGYYNRDKKLGKPVTPRHIMLETQTNVYLNFTPKETFAGKFIYPLEAELDLLSQYEEELLGYVWEMMAKFIFTDLDVDGNWDSYVKQCLKMKAEEILDVRQVQQDRFMGRS